MSHNDEIFLRKEKGIVIVVPPDLVFPNEWVVSAVYITGWGGVGRSGKSVVLV